MLHRSDEENWHDHQLREDEKKQRLRELSEGASQSSKSSEGAGAFALIAIIAILVSIAYSNSSDESELQPESAQGSNLVMWSIPEQRKSSESQKNVAKEAESSKRASRTQGVGQVEWDVPERRQSKELQKSVGKEVKISKRVSRALNSAHIDEGKLTDSITYNGVRGDVRLQYGYADGKYLIKGKYTNSSGKQWPDVFIKVRVYQKDGVQIGTRSFWPNSKPTSIGDEIEIEGEVVVLGEPGMPPKIEIE